MNKFAEVVNAPVTEDVQLVHSPNDILNYLGAFYDNVEKKSPEGEIKNNTLDMLLDIALIVKLFVRLATPVAEPKESAPAVSASEEPANPEGSSKSEPTDAASSAEPVAKKVRKPRTAKKTNPKFS